MHSKLIALSRATLLTKHQDVYLKQLHLLPREQQQEQLGRDLRWCRKRNIPTAPDVVLKYVKLLGKDPNHAEEALFHIKYALQYYPDHIWLLNKAGYILDKQKKYSEALAYYQKAVSLAPTDQLILRNIIWCFNNKKDHTRALEHAQSLLQLGYCTQETLRLIGFIYLCSDAPTKAVPYFIQSIRLNEHDHQAWNFLGQALVSMGAFHTAQNVLKKLVTVHDHTIISLKKLALIKLTRGNIRAAKEYLTMILPLVPGSSLIQDQDLYGHAWTGHAEVKLKKSRLTYDDRLDLFLLHNMGIQNIENGISFIWVYSKKKTLYELRIKNRKQEIVTFIDLEKNKKNKLLTLVQDLRYFLVIGPLLAKKQ